MRHSNKIDIIQKIVIHRFLIIMIKKIKSFVVYRNNMARKYLKASSAVLALPKKIVFVDKKNKKHLLPALTKGKHLASHYGHSAVDLITGKGKFANLVNQGTLEDIKLKKRATKKVKEAMKADAAVKTTVKKAKTAMAEVAKAKRVYKKKKVDASMAAADVVVAKKRGRPRKTTVAADIAAVMDSVVAAPKRRGRPRKTPAAATAAIIDAAAVTAPKRRGRPPGAKASKKKVSASPSWMNLDPAMLALPAPDLAPAPSLGSRLMTALSGFV